MRRWLPSLVFLLLGLLATGAVGYANQNGAWTLHYAGQHNQEDNTCAFEIVDCTTQLEVDGPSQPGRYDIYIVATNVHGIAQSRFGIQCDGNFVFYGWTSCADSEIPTDGWPGCGEGVTLVWDLEQPPGNVTMGILDVYSYGGPSTICASTDPRVGHGEWCDGAPTPSCFQTTDIWRFGCVGFGQPGYSNCPPPIQINEATWGRVKALFRE